MSLPLEARAILCPALDSELLTPGGSRCVCNPDSCQKELSFPPFEKAQGTPQFHKLSPQLQANFRFHCGQFRFSQTQSLQMKLPGQAECVQTKQHCKLTCLQEKHLALSYLDKVRNALSFTQCQVTLSEDVLGSVISSKAFTVVSYKVAFYGESKTIPNLWH